MGRRSGRRRGEEIEGRGGIEGIGGKEVGGVGGGVGGEVGLELLRLSLPRLCNCFKTILFDSVFALSFPVRNASEICFSSGAI